MQAKVEVSYMEIYNEKVHDLLDVNAANGNGNKTAGLKVKFHRNLSVIVFGSLIQPSGRIKILSYL